MTPADKELYQRQIEAMDRQIDAQAYELYGLTEEEIEMAERQIQNLVERRQQCLIYFGVPKMVGQSI